MDTDLYLKIDKIILSMKFDVDNYLNFYITDCVAGDIYTGKVLNIHRYMYTPFSLYGIENDKIITAEYDFILQSVIPNDALNLVAFSTGDDLIHRVYNERRFSEISEREYSEECEVLKNKFAYEYHFKDLYSQGYIVLDKTESYVETIITRSQYNSETRYYKKEITQPDIYGFYWPLSTSKGILNIAIPF